MADNRNKPYANNEGGMLKSSIELGNPQTKEGRDPRILDVSIHGANLLPELKYYPSEKVEFGNIK